MKRNVVLSMLWLIAGITIAPVCSFQGPTSTSAQQRTSFVVPLPTSSLYKSPSSRTSSIRSRTSTELNAVPLPLSSIASPVGALAVLCFVVLVHESGHYLAARTFGMKVEEFSIGVGPKLAGFTALGNDFSFRAFPLGGYVRFPENYNQTLARQAEERSMYIESKTEPKWQRTLTNALTLGAYEQSLQNFEAKMEVESNKKATPFWKTLFGKQKESKTLDATDYEVEYYDDPDLLQNRPWPERAVVIAGGVVFNLILAFLIYFGEITGGQGLSRPVFDQGAVVSTMPASTAAAAGVLSQGDVIVRINNNALPVTPSAAASQRAIADLIAQIRATPDGEALELSVLKAGGSKPTSVTVVPKSNGQVQSIGVMLGPNFARVDTIKTSSIPEATKIAAQCVQELTTETANGIFSVLGGLFQGKGAPAGAKLSGPVGLIKTGSEIVSTNNFATVLAFAAAISVNLAVVNALPLPALDGGQMVFILVEALMGRKVDQKIQEAITSAAVLVLLVLSLGTTVGDVGNLFK